MENLGCGFKWLFVPKHENEKKIVDKPSSWWTEI